MVQLADVRLQRPPRAPVTIGEDMFVAPVGQRSPHLPVGEGIGRESRLMARNPADGEGTEREREFDFSFGQRAALCESV